MGRHDRTTPDPPADARTHYQVLGVPETATRAQIRDAHRQLAHLLHPDRLAGSTSAERTLGERRMREVNAAWSVLSDAGRRSDYDLALRLDRAAPAGGGAAGGGAPRPSGGPRRPEDDDDPDEALARARAAEVGDDEPDLSPGQFWLLRRGPLVAVLVVAVVLFVATAYAGGGGGGAGERPGGATSVPALATGEGNCVQVNDDRVGIRVDCRGPNDGTIVDAVDDVTECPAGSRYVSLTPEYVCITEVGEP